MIKKSINQAQKYKSIITNWQSLSDSHAECMCLSCAPCAGVSALWNGFYFLEFGKLFLYYLGM